MSLCKFTDNPLTAGVAVDAQVVEEGVQPREERPSDQVTLVLQVHRVVGGVVSLFWWCRTIARLVFGVVANGG